MKLITREIINFKNRVVWSWNGFVHVSKVEASMRQWIIANIISGYCTFIVPISHTEQAILLAGGILILAAECMNTAIERVVDDISEEVRPAAKQAKDAGSAAVATTAVATGVAWLVILWGIYL
jgi:diacylglycerol kinase (ATP)